MKRAILVICLIIAAVWPTPDAGAQDKTGSQLERHHLTTPQSVCGTVLTYFDRIERLGLGHPDAAASIALLLPEWPFTTREDAGTAQSLLQEFLGRRKGLTISLQLIASLAADLNIRLGNLPLTECRATVDHTLLIMVLRSDGRDLGFAIHVEWIWSGYLVRRLSADCLIERLKEAHRMKL